MLLHALSIIILAVLVNFAPMLSLQTPAMDEYHSHDLVVFAEPADEVEVAGISARIDSSREKVLQALSTVASKGIRVIIYPSQGALRRKTLGFIGMLLLPDWFIGRNTRDTVLIVSPAAPGPQHTRDSVTQAAVHEYVHVLTDRRNPHLDYWLKEGIALYLAEQIPSNRLIRHERDLTFEEFDHTNPLKFANVGGYTLAYTLIDYLEQTYGWNQVIALIEPEATYISELGLNKQSLFDDWMRYLGKL